MTVSPDDGTVYVVNEADDSVTVIDEATNDPVDPVDTVPVGDDPGGVDVSPDGGSVLSPTPRTTRCR
ncbi:YncE family protein [Streptomyces sp. NPDC047706]|uniref:YncE family protein n=1 Tax=Streptomyces sp. NPDC047706 TaxID=3365486 RepID=UPI0037119318